MTQAKPIHDPPLPTREYRPAYYEPEQRRRDALDIAASCTPTELGVDALMASALKIEAFIRAARTETVSG